MINLLSLWLPILVSAVAVFAAGAVIHMVLPYHRSDTRKLPREDDVLDALRKFALPPDDYAAPLAASMKESRKPEFIAKQKAGPVFYLTVLPNGPSSMGKSLFLWFLNVLAVSLVAGLIACRALRSTEAGFTAIMLFTGVTSFAGYSLGLLPHSIWYGRKWSTTFKWIFDGLVNALVTALVFGWLWPR
jgi:hypothetical protein